MVRGPRSCGDLGLRVERKSDREPLRPRCLDDGGQVLTGLEMNGDAVGPGLGERLEVAFGLEDHQVAIDRTAGFVDQRRNRLEDDRAGRDRRHEVAVADVEVEDTDAGSEQHLDLLA